MIKINQKHLIHTILGHSYIMSVVFFCLAIVANSIYSWKYNNQHVFMIGVIFVLSGTMLSFWAQRAAHVSSKLRLSKNPPVSAFTYGPYGYMRTPTQFALFLMICGLGFVVNIVWICIFSAASFLIAYVFFMNKQEKVLINRYGASYKQYLKLVHF